MLIYNKKVLFFGGFMKKLTCIILSVILVFSIFNFSVKNVHAEDDVTKVNRFYSADTVVSGTTTPDTRVKSEAFTARSNSQGIFKLFVGDHKADTTFTLDTYNSNGDLIETDEVYVLIASLDAGFTIHFTDPYKDFGEFPYKRRRALIEYKASKGVFANLKVYHF